MHLRCKLELRCKLYQLRYSLDSVKILFWLGVGGWVGGCEDYSKNKTTRSQYLVEVEAGLGKIPNLE